MRAIFMGTPDFAVPSLVAVHSVAQVLAVYTQPDRPVGRGLVMKPSPVKVKAEELGLPVFQPEKLSQPGEFERLQALRPDVIVVVAYGQILKRNVLDCPQWGCVNVHSSLLPRWRGAAPIQWALLSGDSETGVTTMKLVEKLDAGDILLQKKTTIHPEDTAGMLHDRLAEMGAELIAPTLRGLQLGELKGRSQDESQVTYASKLTKEMERLDFSQPAEVLDRRIRALSPWPGTSIWIEGKERLKLKEVCLNSRSLGPAGGLYAEEDRLFLSTPAGSLELLKVQWEGKREIEALQFLNGMKGKGKMFPLQVEANPK